MTQPLTCRCQDLNLLPSTGILSSFYPSPVPTEGERTHLQQGQTSPRYTGKQKTQTDQRQGDLRDEHV